MSKDVKKQDNKNITVQELKNLIPQLLEEFCTINKIEDLHKESNNVFMAFLKYVNKTVIEPNKKSLIKCDHGTNNQTDYNKLYEILDLYIDLCMLYDATVTILGFSCFSGLERETIYNLQYKNTHTEQYNNITKQWYKADESSPTGYDIFQKLREFEEQTTLNCRKYNDLRIIARLNRITNGAYRDYTQVDNAITRKALTSEEVVEKYGSIESSENTALLTDKNDE